MRSPRPLDLLVLIKYSAILRATKVLPEPGNPLIQPEVTAETENTLFSLIYTQL